MKFTTGNEVILTCHWIGVYDRYGPGTLGRVISFYSPDSGVLIDGNYEEIPHKYFYPVTILSKALHGL